MRASLRRTLALGLAAVVSGWAAESMVHADYLAYAVTKGGEVPLPEDVTSITKKNAKKLVQVRWGDYAGKRLRIGVLDADNRSTAATYHWTGPQGSYSWSATGDLGQVPVNGIDAILTDVLTQTGRFDVVERVGLNAVLEEQDLGASGRVSQPSAAGTGKVLGAQYLLQVVVNSYEPGVGKKKGGLGGFGRKLKVLGGVTGGKQKNYVSMTFKLTDAETSVVVASEVVEATVSDMNIGLGALGWGSSGALGGFFSNYSKTPIGQAVIAAMNTGVFEVIKQIGNRPLTGSVVAVQDSRVILNLGEGVVSVGDQFMASSKGEALTDPETGIVLASGDEDIGLVKITGVDEKISYAAPVGFDAARLERGDRVVSTRQPEPIQFGAPW